MIRQGFDGRLRATPKGMHKIVQSAYYNRRFGHTWVIPVLRSQKFGVKLCMVWKWFGSERRDLPWG